MPVLEGIRDAIIAQRVNALKADLQRAGASLQAVFTQPAVLQQMDPKAAWTLIHGLQASLEVAERTLRTVRGSGGLPAGPAQQAVADLQVATAHLREVLAEAVVPFAERQFDFPPPGTRWEITPPGE